MSFFLFFVGLFLGLKIFSPNILESKSDKIIALNSQLGKQKLFDSELKFDYLPLSSHFVTQSKLSYCGVASMTMVMNSIDLSNSIVPQYGNSYAFTQDNILNEETEKILPAWRLSLLGMTLEQLGHLFETYPIKSHVFYAETVTSKEFRNLAKLALDETGSFVVVNYSRNVLDQKGFGHISPLAAYNAEIDSFLILDVARYRYPSVWVKAKTLYEAMNTNDFISGKTRGFVIINKI